MGFTPIEVGAMSLYQFSACVDGWNRSQGGDDFVRPPGSEEFHAMKQAHARMELNGR